MTYVEASLEGLPDKWVSSQHIIDCSITLGQNSLGTSVELVLADPQGSIAERLINHSLRTGGIVKLESPEDVPVVTGDNAPYVDATGAGSQPSDAGGWELAIVRGAIKYGVTDKNQIAYMLATAKAETQMGTYLEEIASGAAYEGRQDLGNTQPGDGRRFKGRGLVQTTGRNNYAKMSKILGADFISNPKLLTEARYAVPAMVIGMQRGLYTGASLSKYINGSKVDFYNARRIVNGLDRASEIAGYASNLYLPRVPALIAQAGGSTSALQEKPAVGISKPAASDTATKEQPVKGNKLTVAVGGTVFEFYHQGTEYNQDGITKVVGQGIRWVLNRRARNKTEKNIKLSELAAKVAKAHRVKLAYVAPIDPIYTHIDQTNITDYQLLKRECDRCGLFLSESKGVLTIKALQNITEANYIAQLGVNLISYSIKDQAIDVNADDNGSALMQQQAKVDINPITGQFEQLRVDVDKVKDTATTGKDKTTVGATLQPGQDAIANAAKARVKRVKGLPSSFTVPLDEATLQLEPLHTFRTRNLPGVMSRVWMIDSVRHSIANGSTTVECYAPIDVIAPIDSQPNVGGGSNGTVTAATNGSTTPVTNKNQALYNAAIALKGMSSYNAPGTNNGRLACVWAVNQVLAKAGIANPWNDSLAVKTAKASLQSVATRIPVAQAKPGDIVLWDGRGGLQHIGIVLADGATKVISNSSSKAAWVWVDNYKGVEPSYGGAPTEVYRLK